nr:MAG TPA: hypothetical protein [Caudoviricetes sp.]
MRTIACKVGVFKKSVEYAFMRKYPLNLGMALVNLLGYARVVGQ